MTSNNRSLPSPSDPAPSLESSFVRHDWLLEAAKTFIRKKTGLGSARSTGSSRQRVWNGLARTLLARTLLANTLLSSQAVSLASPSDPEALELLFESHLGPVVLQTFEQDSEARWLICEALVMKVLHKTNSSPDAQNERSVDGERLREACCKALSDLEGGAYPLRAYHEACAKEKVDTHDFWRYLRTAVSHKTSGAFRSKLVKLKFWEKTHSIDAPQNDEDQRPTELPDDPASVGRVLQRMQRRENRKQVIEQLMKLASAKTHPETQAGKRKAPDPDAGVVLKFLEWLQKTGDDIPNEGAQARFAHEAGIPQGTVNSALHRFRKQHGFDKDSRVLRELSLYTTHGGSHP